MRDRQIKTYYGYDHQRDSKLLQEVKDQFKENKERGKDASFKLSYRENRTESRKMMSETKQHFSSFDPTNYKHHPRNEMNTAEK